MRLDATALGERIAAARQRAGLTQQQLAALIGLDRSALAKTELGDRRVTALELARVAEATDSRIEWFVDDAPPAIISRRNAQDPSATSPRIDAEAERIARSVDFVRGHDDRLRVTSLPELGDLTSDAEAEELAREARLAMSTGVEGPITNLGHRVVEIGILPFILDLGAESADAATVLLADAAIAIVNGARPIGRRRLALAHEVGHALVADEYSVDWRVAEYGDADRREGLFDRFARALLLPEPSMHEIWGEAQSDRSFREKLIRAASEYRVDMGTLARRLSECGLISRDEAVAARGMRTTRSDIVSMDLVVGDELNPGTLPREYERAVLRLLQSESISPERALDLLLGAWEASDLPQLPRRAESEVWQFVG